MTKKSEKKLDKRTAGRAVLWFEKISIKDIPLVGGKNASLGEMYSRLRSKGVNIPHGFAVTAAAYWRFLRDNDLDRIIKEELRDLDIADVRALAGKGKKIREAIISAPFSKDLQKEIVNAYKELSKKNKADAIAVAVRSSATAEDLPDASFAGQQESFLNIKGEKELLLAVKKCVASLFTDRAISYRETKGFDHLDIALSVAVQKMVNASRGASGVMFTLDTESGFDKVVLINAAYGLGEYVVKGRVNPDQFFVFKEGIKKKKKAIISRILGSKDVRLVYSNNGGTEQKKNSKAEKDRFSISDDDIAKLAEWGMLIEDFYKKPQDIEWAKDGETGELHIVQARPETVKSRAEHNFAENYQLKKNGKIIATGISVGQKIGAGRARVIENPKDMKNFKKGEVLVTRITDPDWEPIMRMAAAIVTELGGKTSHAAIVSRELGVPCVVGVKQVRKLIKTGRKITVSCASGEEGKIYDNILPFEVKKIEIANISATRTKIMMNAGNPDNAFNLSFLPNDGVGLAREEFIFSNFIRVHPLALIHYDKLKDAGAKKKIAELTRGYRRKSDYCVDKLAEGIARIAAAAYPNEAIVRLSDFKTNEYATLIGGAQFEPKEENPMLGWRGASRYYSAEYKAAFGLECAAIKKAREEWGLNNIIVMVPFCRTPEEGEKVLATMAEFGLKQGVNGLKVYVMCEIPSNVILADDFARIFDGFSIGSNDLTQLTLGVDRDTNMISKIYDEKNDAVKNLIKSVIRTAHKHGKKIGICGQAPSDYPEFAEFLVREGIDSLSLNPDSLLATRERIASVEKTLGRTGKKSHKPFLAMVAAFGILGMSFIGLGVGCAPKENDKGVGTEYISPAEIRKNAEEMTVKREENEMNVWKENGFANFTFSYPRRWTVESWNGGVTFRGENSEFFSVFKQILAHPVSDQERQTIIVDGRSAMRYREYPYASPENKNRYFEIVEIALGDGEVLEINGDTELLDQILSSFKWLESANPERPLTHWDVREKRACVQMIAYARKNKDGECEMFPTPCDVPDDWEVCGGE